MPLTGPDASIMIVREIDLSALVPYVAKPHFIPKTACRDRSRGTDVHQVLLGSCSNGRIED
jgi:3-isopropylmalate/(R)-2-methylmalate dehydratase large subunit